MKLSYMTETLFSFTAVNIPKELSGFECNFSSVDFFELYQGVGDRAGYFIKGRGNCVGNWFEATQYHSVRSVLD